MRNRDFRRGDWNDPEWQEKVKIHHRNREKNKRFFGLALAVIGLAWMVAIVRNIPLDFDKIWPYLMILMGVLIGLKNNFRNSAWWILVLIGTSNIAEIYFPDHSRLVWAGALVVGGIALALRPMNRPCPPNWKMDKSINNDATINMDITFGGRKEVITNKDFKGGNVAVTFGGCELNFMQADFTGTATTLDLRVSFGGVEIIVPSHWDIQNEINPSFGNIEDERSIQTPTSADNRKTLVLRGNCSFGNVEIKSY